MLVTFEAAMVHSEWGLHPEQVGWWGSERWSSFEEIGHCRPFLGRRWCAKVEEREWGSLRLSTGVED